MENKTPDFFQLTGIYNTTDPTMEFIEAKIVTKEDVFNPPFSGYLKLDPTRDFLTSSIS